MAQQELGDHAKTLKKVSQTREGEQGTGSSWPTAGAARATSPEKAHSGDAGREGA